MRAIRLLQVPDVLFYLRVLRGRRTIRITQLLFTFLTVWLTCAGFVALVCTSLQTQTYILYTSTFQTLLELRFASPPIASCSTISLLQHYNPEDDT